MSGLESKLAPLGSFERLERNAKEHDLGGISTSLERFGFLERVIVNETTGHLIGGHGRIDILQQLEANGESPPENIAVENGEWLVPTDYVSIPEEDEEAAALALNRLTELGGWDRSALAEILKDSAEQKEGLRGTGYDLEDLEQLLGDLEYGTISTVQGSEEQQWNPAERFEKQYSVTSLRQIQLVMEEKQYLWALGLLDKIRQEEGWETNTEAVFSALKLWEQNS